MELENILDIPKITDNKIQYFVDNKFVGNITVDQVNKIRENVVKHIINSRDSSILNRFYFVGHRDSNDKAGEEIKITMDVWGNFSDLPWEMNHVRRCLMRITRLEREHADIFYELENDLDN